MTPTVRDAGAPALRKAAETHGLTRGFTALRKAALPLPGQMKPLKAAKAEHEPADPTARVTQANAAARMQPVRRGFINAIQIYPFVEGALYQVYTAPGQITDIALQPGEQLVGSGPVAAGDTVRWIIGDTESGAGAAKQVHILVKPTRPDLVTNLVINTSLRTYHMELRSTVATYMASVSWQYPQDQLIALRRQNATANGPGNLRRPSDLIDPLAGLAHELLTCIGHADPARMADEQRHADLVFQIPNAAAAR